MVCTWTVLYVTIIYSLYYEHCIPGVNIITSTFETILFYVLNLRRSINHYWYWLSSLSFSILLCQVWRMSVTLYMSWFSFSFYIVFSSSSEHRYVLVLSLHLMFVSLFTFGISLIKLACYRVSLHSHLLRNQSSCHCSQACVDMSIYSKTSLRKLWQAVYSQWLISYRETRPLLGHFFLPL